MVNVRSIPTFKPADFMLWSADRNHCCDHGECGSEYSNGLPVKGELDQLSVFDDCRSSIQCSRRLAFRSIDSISSSSRTMPGISSK
jgi:hypothetical protein